MNYSRTKVHSIANTIFLFLIFSFITDSTIAQKTYSSNGFVKTTIVGTSNVHDWEMVSEKGNCTMTLIQDAAGVITGISNVNFNMQVKTLKSSHGNTMDNNAFKAMASDKYPDIKFVSASGTVKANGTNSYTVTAPGKLSISSGTKDVTLIANCKVNVDNSISISGSYKLKTNDYNVKPISIMLGAIKTSEDVTIKFSMSVKL